MTKMKYGPRFGTNYVGGPVGLNNISGPRYHLIGRGKSDIELALITGKGQSNGKLSKARMSKLPNGDPPPPKVKSRTEYEKEFEALVVEVVTRLEHGLEELNNAPPLKSKEVLLINRRQVMEAISRLKQGYYRGGKYR